MSDRPRTIADGVVLLPTDYPAAQDAPLWLYAIGDGRTTALIDSAIPTTYESALRAGMAEAGLDPAGVADIVLTHGHPDHQGGASTWRSLTGARVSAPLDDATWIEDPDRQWRELWDGYPGAISLVDARDVLVGMCGGAVPVDRLLRDGDVVPLADRELEVIQTRGHTRGHVAFLDRRSGCLFTGDVVQGRGLPTTSGTSVIAPMYEDAVDYAAGLRRLRATPFETLCPAHREPLDHAAGIALIDASLAFLEEIAALVRDLVDAGEVTSTAAVAARIGEVVGARPPVTMQTVTAASAHLAELARAGLVEQAWRLRAVPGHG